MNSVFNSMKSMKKHILKIISSFSPNFNHQMKWDFLKYEICKITVPLTKQTKSIQDYISYISYS